MNAPAFVSNRSGTLTHTVTGKAAGNYSLYLQYGDLLINLGTVSLLLVFQGCLLLSGLSGCLEDVNGRFGEGFR